MKKIFLLVLLLQNCLLYGQNIQTLGNKNNTVRANGRLDADSGTYSKGVKVLTQADTVANLVTPASLIPAARNAISVTGTGGSYNSGTGVINLAGITQVNADWNSESGISQILNKPVIPATATSIVFNSTNGILRLTKSDASTIETNLDNRYAFTAAANGDTLSRNVVLDGADPTGVLNSTAAFRASQATGKSLYLPSGATFRLDIGGSDSTIIQLNADQNVYGNNSKLITTSDATLIAAGDRSTIANIDIYGSGKGVSNKTYQTGIFSNGKKDVRVTGVHLYDISGNNKGHKKPSGGIALWHQGAHFETATLNDIHATRCNLGINLGESAEYVNISTGSLDSNAVAFYCMAGNYNFGNFGGQDNDTSLWLGSGTNNGHGSITNVMLNHSPVELIIDSVNVSYPTLFTAVTLNSGSTHGKVYINNSTNIAFSNSVISFDTIFINNSTGLTWFGGGRLNCVDVLSNGGSDFITTSAISGAFGISASISGVANNYIAGLYSDGLTNNRLYKFPDYSGTIMTVDGSGVSSNNLSSLTYGTTTGLINVIPGAFNFTLKSRGGQAGQAGNFEATDRSDPTNEAYVRYQSGSSSFGTIYMGKRGSGSYNPFRIYNEGYNSGAGGFILTEDINGNLSVPGSLASSSIILGSIKILTGTGVPSIAAPIGSLYLRTDGGTNTTLYVKESATDATGWIPK